MSDSPVARALLPLWLRHVGAVIAATAFGLLLFGTWCAEQILRDSEPEPIGDRLVTDLTSAYTFLILIPAVAWVTRRAPLSREARARWRLHLPIHAAAVIAFSAAHTTLVGAARHLLFALFALAPDDDLARPLRYVAHLPTDVIVYGLLVVGVEKVDRLRAAIRHQVRAAEIEAQWARVRLENLRLQLHPHFLFNALNTISSVVYESAPRADAMIGQLGELLRRALSSTSHDEVSLREELALLQNYLDIMCARFEDRLTLRIAIDDAALDALVPPLLLQPLAENAIRHGNVTRRGRGLLALTVRREIDQLWIEVSDDGPGARAAAATLLRRGIGLSSTAERLQHLYGARHSFALTDVPDGGFRVTVGLPYRTAVDHAA